MPSSQLPILMKEENPDELKLLQSRFKIDVQKSSSRGQPSHASLGIEVPNGVGY